jgi:L-2-hydroxyglutarate oxidase LhgO
MAIYDVETLVVGAGVVGLAISRALAFSGKSVWVIEAESQFGAHTSSRNSEVIHAGLYYSTESLKASLCVKGRKQLYRYCVEKQIPFKQCGKLIVATQPDQLGALQTIEAQAVNNGVEDICWLNAKQVAERTPALKAEAGLWSGSTGILDSHAFMQHLLWDAEAHGAQVVFNTRVLSGEILEGKFLLHLETSSGSSPSETFSVRCKRLVNAAGLNAVDLASSLKGFSERYLPKIYFAKGNYFSLSIPCPFQHLIYPIPEEGGLGVHLTLDLDGRGRFGPDVEWLTTKHNGINDYLVNESKIKKFEQAIRHYWLDLPSDVLQPDYAGIRPKLSGPGEAAADFMIQDESVHGISGLINLLGIESPGLTAAMAIADEVVNRLQD